MDPSMRLHGVPKFQNVVKTDFNLLTIVKPF